MSYWPKKSIWGFSCSNNATQYSLSTSWGIGSTKTRRFEKSIQEIEGIIKELDIEKLAIECDQLLDSDSQLARYFSSVTKIQQIDNKRGFGLGGPDDGSSGPGEPDEGGPDTFSHIDEIRKIREQTAAACDDLRANYCSDPDALYTSLERQYCDLAIEVGIRHTSI